MIRARHIAVASFFFTVVFFIEYTPIFRHARNVHIPFDLEAYHYPLADYAFQSIHQGRFPQWDPTIYSGLTFAGNIQAALFYPPTWLMFAFNVGRSKLTYQALEDLTLAHVWLAFLLCYIWLRQEHGLHPLACVFGAGVFAFSGYMLCQLQHFGLVAGYTWMPLGFAGIDAADRRRDWRPMWKVAAASAMCFLAGYPSTWVAFCVWMIAYACGRKGALRLAPQVVCALVVSLLLAAVQLAPAWEATKLRAPETKFSGNSGMKDPEYFISYFLPNYFDFGLDVPSEKNPGRDYLYLGAPAFAGLALLLIRKRFTAVGPPLAVLITSLMVVINPLGSVARVIEPSKMLTQVISTYYFLGGVTAALALLTGLGLDHGLKRTGKPAPRWLAATAIALSLGWSIWLIFLWHANRFAVAWWSGADAIVAAVLFGLLLLVFTASSGMVRACTAGMLLILAAAEYKAFGTSKRLNANRGRFTLEYISNPSPGMNATTYATLRAHPEYRSAIDVTAMSAEELRHVGLTTPQGMDPFLPEQYRAFAGRIGNFRNNREFDLKPEDDDSLKLLGVRYYITSAYGPLYSRISSNPHFQRLLPDDSYYKVFELAGSQPSFGWENSDSDHAAELKVWQPERRGFLVGSDSGGRFRLSEQFYPGWRATVDGMETSIERCREAFQCIAVAPGKHAVEFRYHSRWLLLGAAISLCSILLLAKLVRG